MIPRGVLVYESLEPVHHEPARGRGKAIPFFGLSVVLHLLGNLSTFISGFRFIGGFLSLFGAYSISLLLYLGIDVGPVSLSEREK